MPVKAGGVTSWRDYYRSVPRKIFVDVPRGVMQKHMVISTLGRSFVFPYHRYQYVPYTPMPPYFNTPVEPKAPKAMSPVRVLASPLPYKRKFARKVIVFGLLCSFSILLPVEVLWVKVFGVTVNGTHRDKIATVPLFLILPSFQITPRTFNSQNMNYTYKCKFWFIRNYKRKRKICSQQHLYGPFTVGVWSVDARATSRLSAFVNASSHHHHMIITWSQTHSAVAACFSLDICMPIFYNVWQHSITWWFWINVELCLLRTIIHVYSHGKNSARFLCLASY